MRIIKSFIIAFSMYSSIPMPQFEWKDEDMKYILCFFPWVGAVVGACIYLWKMICDRFGIGLLCYTCIGAVIPLLITGGFHADGFMDTMDAFHSYQPKEKKMEILKDSHIGAFSVIMLGIYGLIYFGAFSEIRNDQLLQIVCAGFFLARVLSGIGVVSFPSAKKEGLLYLFSDSAQKNIVKIALYTQGVLCIGFMLWRSFGAGLVVAAAGLGAFAYYYKRCKREFGGITGDTAGYFVLICECCIMVSGAVLNIFG
ncbi:MAG: adenosylcobinamide-GDP ribazoletransferase [Frisingicoccus sp.]|nr:adenosylcobinamide-GDP ribazoletransferase [Frisingicoccus sp.]